MVSSAFLVDPGIDGFTMITEPQLRKALPHVARTGLPLMVHAELSGPMDAAKAVIEAEGANWKRYNTYLRSRPDEAELSAIRMLLSLCREFKFRLHIVHLATSRGLPLDSRREGGGLARHASKRVRTISTKMPKRSLTAPRSASALLLSAEGRTAKSCGRGCAPGLSILWSRTIRRAFRK